MTATHALYADITREALETGNEHWFIDHLLLAERARAAAFDSPMHSMRKALRVRSVESFRTILSVIASIRGAAPKRDLGVRR